MIRIEPYKDKEVNDILKKLLTNKEFLSFVEKNLNNQHLFGFNKDFFRKLSKRKIYTFNLSDLPIALKYARERIDDAIKIVIKPWS